MKKSRNTYVKNQVKIPVKENSTEKGGAHSELTVENLCDRFLEYYETNRAPGTYKFYKMFLDRLKEFCGKKPVTEITPFDIEDIKRHYMKRGCSVTTINDSIRTAKTAYIYIHCLRHTFASRLVLRGVPLTVVAELLGHTDIQTTQMYAHLAPSDLQRAIDKLDNLPV